jgi:hypothetical protein
MERNVRYANISIGCSLAKETEPCERLIISFDDHQTDRRGVSVYMEEGLVLPWEEYILSSDDRLGALVKH